MKGEISLELCKSHTIPSGKEHVAQPTPLANVAPSACTALQVAACRPHRILKPINALKSKPKICFINGEAHSNFAHTPRLFIWAQMYLYTPFSQKALKHHMLTPSYLKSYLSQPLMPINPSSTKYRFLQIKPGEFSFFKILITALGYV